MDINERLMTRNSMNTNPQGFEVDDAGDPLDPMFTDDVDVETEPLPVEIDDPLGEKGLGADPAGDATIPETVKDMGQGAVSGLVRGADLLTDLASDNSLVGIVKKLGRMAGFDITPDRPKGTAGQVTEAFTQILPTMIPATRLARLVIGTSTFMARVTAEVVGGLVADFATSGKEEADGLVDLVQLMSGDERSALAAAMEEFIVKDTGEVDDAGDPIFDEDNFNTRVLASIPGAIISPLFEGALKLGGWAIKGGAARDFVKLLKVFKADEGGQAAAEPKPIIVEAIDPELEKEAARAVTEPGAFGSGGAGTTGGATGARVSTTGQYVGAPKGTSTPQALGALRRKIKKTTLTGEPGRFWYERSSKQILDAVGGDKVEADKFAQLLAIYSQGTGVKANFTAALQAFNQAKAGIPIAAGRFSPSQAIRAQKVMDGIDWPGRKTNNFYNNLMVHIDPTRAQGVTADIWIARAFGFKNPDGTPFGIKQKDGKAGLTTPTDAQYDFIEKELKRIADDLGWEPQQVQAAMWVAQKASDEGTSLAAAGFDFADALQNSLGQVSWESIPGKTSGHLGEMFSAPYAQQVEYHQAISKAFLDDDGRDIIAKRLGILSPNDFEAPGFFEGKVSPGTQTNVAIPTKFKDTSPTGIDEGAELLVSAYSAVRGILMKQDGVGWHRPFFGVTKKGSNGIEVTVGRPLSETETVQLSQLIAEEAGHKGYNPIGSKNGIRLINFDHLNVDNKEFQAIINRALDRMEFDGGDEYVAELFGSKNGYHDNNWSVLKNGEGYLEGSLEGQPDLQRRVLDIVRELAPRIDTVDDDFIRRYGWTANTDLNATFRGVGQ
jgi:hypothetical protein